MNEAAIVSVDKPVNVARPDFFIAGAPKCGTTALHNYLQPHPDIFLPKRKEVHYFGSDILARWYPDNLDDYLSNFTGAAGEKRIGESAIWYLFSRDAAEQINAFDPQARAIVMLRDPRDMIYSYHSQRLYNGNENIEDFAEALEAIPHRLAGRRMPDNVEPLHALDYLSLGMYHGQLSRLFATFGRERVHVIVYDDFKADTSTVYRKVLEFLDVDCSFQPVFKIVNASKKTRSKYLRSILRTAPRPLLIAVKALLPSKKLRTRIKDKLVKANSQTAARPQMDPVVRQSLTDHYRDDVAALSTLLGRDLTAEWGYGPSAAPVQ